MRRTRRFTAAAAFAPALALCGVSAAAAQAVAPAEAVFDVEAYDVDGNSLLDQISIEKAVYAHLGPGRSKDDIEAARKGLEDVYHARGFDSVVVEVPAQTVADKVVRLHVVETEVGRLRVTGSRYYSLEDVKRQAPALSEGAVPNFRAAEAQIAELNRIPGRQVNPIVRPGKLPGTVDVDLKVTDHEPAHASVEITNDHSPDTTPLRLTGSVHYDNLWQRGHSLSFSYSVAPMNRAESEVFATSYLAPIPNSLWSVLVYGYTSNSNVATIGDVSVLGKGSAVGVRGIAQLPALGPVSESLSVGGDFKHTSQFILPGAATSTASSAAIDYWPLNAVYSLQWESNLTSVHASLGVTAGVRGGGAYDAIFQINRANARGNFVHTNLDIDATRQLPLGLEANARVSSQFANQALVSGEQFSLGGLSSVRGYLQAAAVGDDGVFGSLELRSPPITFAPRRLIDDWRLFGFGDTGTAWLIQPLADQQSRFNLHSAGLGARFRLLRLVDGSVVVGVPLAAARLIDVGRPYANFSLKAGF